MHRYLHCVFLSVLVPELHCGNVHQGCVVGLVPYSSGLIELSHALYLPPVCVSAGYTIVSSLQSHTYVFTAMLLLLLLSVHIPPFWHGLDAHSSMSVWQFVPSHPAAQSHE